MKFRHFVVRAVVYVGTGAVLGYMARLDDWPRYLAPSLAFVFVLGGEVLWGLTNEVEP